MAPRDRKQHPMSQGDAVEVRGSRIQIDKKPAILAIEVKRGDDVPQDLR